MIDLILHPGRERSLQRRHPWVLSGAVAKVADAAGRQDPPPGEWTRVLSAGGEVLGYGHYSPKSAIRVRLLSHGKEEPGAELIAERIAAAVARRRRHPLLADTDALRLVNAEGDGLPGLVVDQYADTAVVRLTSAGMEVRRSEIADALVSATGAAVGYERPEASAARREGFATRQGRLWGAEPEADIAIHEASRHYSVDVREGQKTGFYLDQRDARDVVQRIARGARVLDLFAYTGGFAVAAACGGAASVTLVDSSVRALERAEAHLDRNAPDTPREIARGDAFEYLRGSAGAPATAGGGFDLMIVDPPPLARNRADLRRASRAYKDLLLFAFRAAPEGARVLAFACSHNVGADLFRKIAFGAALDAERSPVVTAVFGQPADHPVSIFHPEGAYLNGILLEL